MAKHEKNNPFLDITWDDLSKWFGETIVKRGKSYKSEVSKMGRTEDGKIIAWVQGTKRYAATIWMNKDRKIHSDCSCPFGGMCKHGVALTLVYLDSLKEKKEIPVIDNDDSRLRLLGLSNQDEEEDAEEDLSSPPAKRKPSKSKAEKDDIRAYLSDLPQSELVDLIEQIGDSHPDVKRMFQDRVILEQGDVKSIVKSLRAEIRSISSGGMSYDDWGGEDDAPNYARIQELLKLLLDKGHADDVVKLGRDLWDNGVEQAVNDYNDDFAATYLMECMEIVFKALLRSSRPKSEQLLWLIEIRMEDDYGFMDVIKDPIKSGRFAKTDWSAAADILLDKLKKRISPKEGEKDFSARYNRGKLVGWVCRAFEASGRQAEIIPLLEKETPYTQNYRVLIARLLDAGRKEEAKQWALRGYNNTLKSAPGIASDMIKQLRELAMKAKQYALVASYDAVNFFCRPSFSEYKILKESAEKAGLWPQVRNAVHCFLETGQYPDSLIQTTSTADPGNKRIAKSNKPEWPLPPTELSHLPTVFRSEAPMTNLLIEIAIADSDTEEVLRLYQSKTRTAKSFGYFQTTLSMDTQVAEFLKRTHPDVSLNIWKNHAESLIHQTGVKAYQSAAAYLKKMKAVYQDLNRLDEWNDYLSSLKVNHKNKPRLMEILLGLEGEAVKKKPKKIIEG